MSPGNNKAAEGRFPAGIRQRRARAEELLGLFAWHKDPPLVARALRLSLDELQAELDDLGIRRKAFRLARGGAADVPRARSLPAVAGGPPLRRRARREAPPPDPSPAPEPIVAVPATVQPSADEVGTQAKRLRSLLAEIGPRRRALTEKLGTKGRPLSTPVLLARFRAAGLERELGQRERDLLRALFARHRGGERKVAKDLGIPPKELQDLVRDRGLVREVEAMRERYRDEARRAPWPAEQLANLVLRRAWLTDLGLYRDLERLAAERAAPAWRTAKDVKDPVRALQRELLIGPAEARFLRGLLSRGSPR